MKDNLKTINTPNQSNVLIVGANQGIGLGFVKKILEKAEFNKIYATYRRQESAAELLALAAAYPEQICCLAVDVTEEKQIEKAAARIREEGGKLHLAVNCAGILQEGDIKPEKSLKQINPAHLLRYFQVNSMGSLLLAKHLLPLFRHGERSILAAISAKVGSIGDNQLGGWYGYRASKAALNMFMHNIAIEYRRTSPRTIVVMLHPGTTDTRLSQPFQKNVPAGKLYSVERTVSQLLEVMANLTEEDSGHFFSWDGTQLPW
jgi:NAD(P)-dependent dehydrogenase (short-subunit alcohol dehydrogenase family)